ncbi:MAG: septum formation protein Maf [Planctomycetes bacterium]|nr:septum formation protein Maf [Planctomycetota bacterium]MCC7172904.1 septum formation protein Maf [Planctomycetota bacterium]
MRDADASDPRLPIVLASASERRKSILHRLGFAYRIDPADIDETPTPGASPREVAMRLAREKARTVAARTRAGTVIGADTVVATRAGLLGKPEDAAQARRFLEILADSTHEVITGLALVRAGTGLERVSATTTRVTMRALTAAEIDAYVASGEPFGKAGGYAIQENADRFVTRLDGSFDNVVGFPSETFLVEWDAWRADLARAGGSS